MHSDNSLQPPPSILHRGLHGKFRKLLELPIHLSGPVLEEAATTSYLRVEHVEAAQAAVDFALLNCSLLLAPYLHTIELYRLSITCQALRPKYALLIAERIDRALHAFVDHQIDEFRDVLRSTQSFVSGSLVYRILQEEWGTEWSPGDMDIYIGPEQPICDLLGFICYKLGYKEESLEDLVPQFGNYEEADEPAPMPSSILTVYHFSKQVTRPDESDKTRHIDVIVSSYINPIASITRFPATHAMNWLSADSLCVGYPLLMLAGKSLLHQRSLPPTTRVWRWISKYMSRGVYFVSSTADLDASCKNACPAVPRAIQDSASLFIPYSRLNEAVSTTSSRRDTCGGPSYKWTLAVDDEVVTCQNRRCPRGLLGYDSALSSS